MIKSFKESGPHLVGNYDVRVNQKLWLMAQKCITVKISDQMQEPWREMFLKEIFKQNLQIFTLIIFGFTSVTAL